MSATFKLLMPAYALQTSPIADKWPLPCEKLRLGAGNVRMVRFVTFDSSEIFRIAAGEIEMIAEPKFKAHQDDNDRDKRERRIRRGDCPVS